MSDSFDEQRKIFENLIEEAKSLEKENEELKERIQRLEAKYDDLELRERASNILISGVPKQADPDTKMVASKIMSTMSLLLAKNNIVESFGLGKRDDVPILVKLSNVQTKEDIIKKIRELKGITVKKCQLEGKDGKVYINKDLPINVRALLKKARDIKKANRYGAVFCNNGTIYLKKTDHDHPVKN